MVFLRQLLGLNQLAPLFTETSIMPVRFRQITLALGFLKYLMGLTPGQYAQQALYDSIYLAETGRSSWVRDLQLVLLDLPTPLTLPDLRTTTTTGIDDTIKAVLEFMDSWLKAAIDDSPKLYLLHGRKVPDKDGGLPRHKTLHFQHYLSVNNADHRKFVTHLLLSCHLLLTLFDAAPIYVPALPVEWMIT